MSLNYDLLDKFKLYIATKIAANKICIWTEGMTQQLKQGQNSDPLNPVNVQKACQTALISASEGRDKESLSKLPREIP